MQKQDQDLMWPGTWELRESSILTHVKAKNVLFGWFKGSHGMWSINDLPEKTEKSTFSGGGYFYCFDVTAHSILHRGSSKHYIMPKKSMRDFASFSNCALLHINQSSARNKRKELGGKKSWKPLVFLESVNRPLDSEDQTSWIGLWRWSLLQVGLKMKNASMRKEINIKQGVAFDLKSSLFELHISVCLSL